MRENLKNVVLFMASTGCLSPPARDSSKSRVWDETWARLDRFLPDLRGDLAVEGPEVAHNAKDSGSHEKEGRDKSTEEIRRPALDSAESTKV